MLPVTLVAALLAMGVGLVFSLTSGETVATKLVLVLLALLLQAAAAVGADGGGGGAGLLSGPVDGILPDLCGGADRDFPAADAVERV